MSVPFSKIIQNNNEYDVVDKITQAMIAQPFDKNKSGGYKVDDVVTYANKLYKFTSAHSGAWTGLDVEQVDVADTINIVNEKVDDLNTSLNGYKFKKIKVTTPTTASTTNIGSIQTLLGESYTEKYIINAIMLAAYNIPCIVGDPSLVSALGNVGCPVVGFLGDNLMIAIPSEVLQHYGGKDCEILFCYK